MQFHFIRGYVFEKCEQILILARVAHCDPSRQEYVKLLLPSVWEGAADANVCPGSPIGGKQNPADDKS
jgi:hypothetical protein